MKIWNDIQNEEYVTRWFWISPDAFLLLKYDISPIPYFNNAC